MITADRAHALGVTSRQIQRRLDAGLWTAEAMGVYLSAEHCLSDAAQVRIAVAAQGGIADRTTAAWWHGLIPELPSPLTVSVPRSKRGARCGFRVETKRRTFPAEDVEVVRGLPVTRLPLTVLAAAAELDDGIAVMDRALQRKQVDLIDLRRSLERNSGAHGMRRARWLLTAAEDESESVAERLFVSLLRERGITGWTQQVPFCDYRLDFAWTQEQIGVEIHGWNFHHDHHEWERDQRKTNQLVRMGWLPLIFTWARLTMEPDACMAELAEAILLRQSV
ncbi:DUF559 domain-containing protein [Gordonia hydrophobica]|uniref:DUF559 domain-containing protein n=1 Tax=Gordonia hydrophobica TaxID=40516 RepID=A0ABZ2U6F0_9ACTN|nr:DUF559 domain-containing protein [Gordonia hydrophobica]MBM7365506.1 very-short-patch-repair endonuclease [Gordonia hydrophobica]